MKNKKSKQLIIVLGILFLVIIAAITLILLVNSFKYDSLSKTESSDFTENFEAKDDDFSENLVSEPTDKNNEIDETSKAKEEDQIETQTQESENAPKTQTNISGNCTESFGRLMLINPNFTVTTEFITNRKSQLLNLTEQYGIREGNQWNGVPLLDAEAAKNLNDMLMAYKEEYPGHEITTRSCFRSQGTNCGRLCYATGTSDHHSGYTCDLVDDYYGDSLDTDLKDNHPEWQWLHENSYRFGFIDRFIESWAGGSMSEPVNVDANGTTGLYESWHYRYVGKNEATEIATGKYNGGNYDSLEHYLKASGRIRNLLDRTSCN